MCFINTHGAKDCLWVYTSCKKPTCNGLRKLLTSYTPQNYGRKYLQCHLSSCSLFQWLNHALKEVEGVSGSSKDQTQTSYFGCGKTDHWWRSCPWRETHYHMKGFTKIIKLKTSMQPKSNGEKYLKCQNDECKEFIWLRDAIHSLSQRRDLVKLRRKQV
ncbi:hypothetical protein GIB67_018995 [Kingdonia uniflora]|uniref:Zinc finger GRF-type domain-containing protein n=1 Tax=Kingdonia uniflora TaxID=39325 RepID=A0A7J7LA27_9MAGN|nr:hypothetical protein GIB67_033164 [Kingdonia uniflora]KAF6140505.1 hypothetical protein GIB67_027981 [Kingdonia uniflora]KAF6154073.1 hypothetical protein GIB67_018995 [Kingdonia uniflora]